MLGSGRLGTHRIVSYREDSGTVSVGAVAVSTYSTSVGEWELLTKHGRLFSAEFIHLLFVVTGQIKTQHFKNTAHGFIIFSFLIKCIFFKFIKVI